VLLVYLACFSGYTLGFEAANLVVPFVSQLQI